MKRKRLFWLAGVMGVLAVLRVLAPPLAHETPPVVAEAIVRKAAPATIATAAAPLASALAFTSAFVPAPPIDDLEPGNAFAVRPPPAPPYVPPPPKVAHAQPVAPAPVVTPAATEPLPPPVPYQVIGTWDDGKTPGVFLSSPNGTLLAHLGATLQAEYKVTAITPQQISLMHLATKREVRLAIPMPSPTQTPNLALALRPPS